MSAPVTPDLPAVYEPVFLDSVDSVLAEGIRRAEAGAAEGTLICAQEQLEARTRRGHRWQAPSGNLHCAIVMRPDFPPSQAQQLCLVAALAAGAAVAEVVTPMTGCSFAWPGDIRINDLLAAQIQLAAGPRQEHWDWLVIAASVNVAHHPMNPEPERFNSIHASAGGDAEHVGSHTLLEYYARHFLRGVNRWAEDGYDSVRESWTQRAHDMADLQRMQDLCPRDENARCRLGDDASLMITTHGQPERMLTIAEYFDLGTTTPQS